MVGDLLTYISSRGTEVDVEIMKGAMILTSMTEVTLQVNARVAKMWLIC